MFWNERLETCSIFKEILRMTPIFKKIILMPSIRLVVATPTFSAYEGHLALWATIKDIMPTWCIFKDVT